MNGQNKILILPQELVGMKSMNGQCNQIIHLQSKTKARKLLLRQFPRFLLLPSYLFRFESLSRSPLSRIFFRGRIESGDTSQYSTSFKYCIASSNDISSVFLITDVWSLLAERILVKCFSRVILTVKSFSRLCSPTIIPAYTSTPGSRNIVPRSSKCKIPYADVLPFSKATNAPSRRPLT